MKLIPAAIARKVAQQGLLASEHAPKTLFVGGVVGMVGSTVLACRATLKLEGVIDQIELDKREAHLAKATVDAPGYEGKARYSDAELRKDLSLISFRGVVSIAKLYAPSVILGSISIAALTKSHNLLQDRNIALTAAYVAIDGAFTRYRERVIDRYGEETDRELRYDSEEVEFIDMDTGEMTTGQIATDAPGSAYARFYDEWSSRNWSPDPDINMLFLRNVQNYMNDKLKSRGHVFLNEIFTELGLSHTTAGAIVGWRWRQDSGDDFIDFGIWDGVQERVNDFFHGREGAILLDFNVDGVIYDKIERGDGE